MWGEGFLIPQCNEQLISGFTFVSKRKNIVIFPNVHVLCFKFCQTGKVDPQQPRVSGHRGNVLDIKWNPFNECCIASCSEDATVCTPKRTQSPFSVRFTDVLSFSWDLSMLQQGDHFIAFRKELEVIPHIPQLWPGRCSEQITVEREEKT